MSHVDYSKAVTVLMPDERWTGIASSVYTPYTPAKLMDGTTGTFFHTNGGTKALQWVQIDMAREVVVSERSKVLKTDKKITSDVAKLPSSAS